MERPDVENTKYEKVDKGFFYTDYHQFMDDRSKYIDHLESQLKEVNKANDRLTIQNLVQFGQIDKLKKAYKHPNDATQSLLNDIISWELDISQYESLESILKNRYDINLKQTKDESSNR